MWTNKHARSKVGLALTAPAPLAEPDAAMRVTFYPGVPMTGELRYDGDPPEMTFPRRTTLREVVAVGMGRGLIHNEDVVTLYRLRGDAQQRRVQRDWVGPRIPLDAAIGAYPDFLRGSNLDLMITRPGRDGPSILCIGFWLTWDYAYGLPSNLLNTQAASPEPFGNHPVYNDPVMYTALRNAVFLQTPRGFIVADSEAALALLADVHPTTGETFPAPWAAAASLAVQNHRGSMPLYLRLDPPPAPWRGAVNAAPMQWPAQ
jgi:hypothetical protein